MPLSPSDVANIEGEAHDWIVARAERQIDEQSSLAKAQDARAVMMLTTSVILSTLSALVAAIALAVPRNDASVLVASLAGLAGFSLASSLVLFSVRSPSFNISGAPPSRFVEGGRRQETLAALRKSRVLELEECLSENRRMLEQRRYLGNWALWTLMATPLISLLYGWLASTGQ